MDERTLQLVEQKCNELLRLARRYEAKARFMGSDLDEALLSAMEYFCFHPTSTHRPMGVFRTCLRREYATRLKFGNKEEKQ